MLAMPSDLTAGVVVHTSDLTPTLAFLTDTIGFRVEKIFPADDPVRCTLVGHGCRLHLEPGTPTSTLLRLETIDRSLLDHPRQLGPEGLEIEFIDAQPALHIPPLESHFSLTHAADAWHTGRAGMMYRDLVPDRQGGAVIASHIRIPGSGPVPDYVHFHEVAFQLIFCRRGSVKVVYEDQGDPFVLHAGDCVTQPPRIRHRVLESSDDLEVIEIGYPAEHITRADPETHLPSPTADPSRTWDGQAFVHHRRADAGAEKIGTGVTILDTGVAAGTHNLADVAQIDIEDSTWSSTLSEENEFVLLVLLEGSARALLDGPSGTRDHHLEAGSALVVPVGHGVTIVTQGSASLLQVRIRTEGR